MHLATVAIPEALEIQLHGPPDRRGIGIMLELAAHQVQVAHLHHQPEKQHSHKYHYQGRHKGLPPKRL
jgi:hypothetical protein